MRLFAMTAVFLPFVVTVAQRYDKESGIGTMISLMLPYTVVVAVAWTPKPHLLKG